MSPSRRKDPGSGKGAGPPGSPRAPAARGGRPSRPPGRAEQKVRTREALREAGRALFAERGFADVLVADIARAAGVAHGTFYVHFPGGKEQLLDALLADFNEALVARLEAAWQPGAVGAPLETARAVAALCLDAWSAERGLVAAFAQRAGLDGSLVALRDGINPPVAALLAGRLSALAAALGRELPDAVPIAQALLGLWTRVALQHLWGGLERDRAVELLATLSLGALSAPFPELRAALP